jgi:hypothetical protein
VLDKADKFKEWVIGKDPDEKIAAEYFKAVTTQGWINSLPAKVVRYFAPLAADVAIQGGGVVALGLSAVDQVLVERVLRGWRPNHFVDTTLRPFVGES